MTAHQIPAQVHGRYLVDAPAGPGPFPLLVGFHGYAEKAEHMLDVMQRIRGTRRWLLVSVQGLNRFYTRANDVVASWMTREDRELEIADNIVYVRSIVSRVRRDYPCSATVVYTGFSQGVAMAYRAAAFAADGPAGVPPASGAIVLAGDVPPDVAPQAHVLPPVLLGRGREDLFYPEAKATADLRVLARGGVEPRVHVFAAGHVWDVSFVEAASEFLDQVEPTT